MGASTQVFPHNIATFGVDVVIDGEFATAHFNTFGSLALLRLVFEGD